MLTYYDVQQTYGTTTIQPLALIMLIMSCIGILAVKRKYAIWPIVIMTCFVASGQRIVIFSLDFNFLRVMIIVGLMRVLFRGELSDLKRHKIDIFVLTFAFAMAMADILRTGGTALVYELGNTLDIAGSYYVFRCLIRDWDDLDQIIKLFIFVSIPLACFFVLESMTGRNIFAIFGEVPDITQFRGGRLRSQGAFAHPIIAGVFVAAVIPLVAAKCWDKVAKKKWVIIGLLGLSVVVIACASSTPLFAVLAGLIGAIFFLFREHMRLIRWGILAVLVALHLVMQAPVWNLIARVSAVGGSTSWYRFALIDGAVNHFNEWWLIGTETTTHWFYGAGDLTDEFVGVCANGGILSFVLFLATIGTAFQSVGRTWRNERKNVAKTAMAWSLGVSLFALCLSFVGIAIWGQLIVIWYMLLAAIASMDRYSTDVFALVDKGLDRHRNSLRNR